MISLDLKLTCPKCGRSSQMRAFGSEETVEIARLAARFGRSWPWVEEYMHCFQADYDKPLKPARVKIVLGEILEMIEKKGFRYDREDHAVRPDALFRAIRYVAQTNKTGFKNHNYLKKVAININQQLISEEEKEQKKRGEEAMRRGFNPGTELKRIREIYENL